jgi:hypothetical protein
MRCQDGIVVIQPDTIQQNIAPSIFPTLAAPCPRSAAASPDLHLSTPCSNGQSSVETSRYCGKHWFVSIWFLPFNCFCSKNLSRSSWGLRVPLFSHILLGCSCRRTSAGHDSFWVCTGPAFYIPSFHSQLVIPNLFVGSEKRLDVSWSDGPWSPVKGCVRDTVIFLSNSCSCQEQKQDTPHLHDGCAKEEC